MTNHLTAPQSYRCSSWHTLPHLASSLPWLSKLMLLYHFFVISFLLMYPSQYFQYWHICQICCSTWLICACNFKYFVPLKERCFVRMLLTLKMNNAWYTVLLHSRKVTLPHMVQTRTQVINWLFPWPPINNSLPTSSLYYCTKECTFCMVIYHTWHTV